MSEPGSSFQPSTAGTRFLLLSVKRTTRSISRQHPSQILNAISRPITHPLVKDSPLSVPSSSCPTAEFNMCRLIGCDAIRCPGCIVSLNLGHLSQWKYCLEEGNAHVCCVGSHWFPECDSNVSLCACGLCSLHKPCRIWWWHVSKGWSENARTGHGSAQPGVSVHQVVYWL